MQMPSRHWQAYSLDQYRFGFQGMRKGNQLYGDGNLYETPFRNYDPRLGRWLLPDPIQHPWQGSYTAFNNNPIYFVDPMGLEGEESDGSGDGDDEIIEGGFYSGPVTVTPDEEGNNNTAKMPMTGKSPEEMLSEQKKVKPAPTMDDLNHVDIFEPTSEKVSRKQFNRDFNLFIRNASDETVGELISRDSRLPLRLKLRAIRLTVSNGQTEFIYGLSDAVSRATSRSSLALTITGTGLMFVPFPGARAAGISMLYYGGTTGMVSSGIDGAQNFAKGNYTRGFINAGSIVLSKGTSQILKRMHANGNISYHEMYVLDGGSSIGQTYGTKKGKRLLLPRR
jgi:RHS repeat-associated protein